MPDQLFIPAGDRPLVPHFEQWLGVWAMREADFQAGLSLVQRMDLHLHLQQVAEAQASGPNANKGSSGPETSDGIAVIGIRGSLMKHQSSMGTSTSTVEARRMIRAAANNENVRAILLHVDSPGGTVAGTQELADDVAAAAKKKPVQAFIEDLGASAAYWIASQASYIAANRTALIGSIGTYGVVYDESGAAAMQGVKVHVVRAGAFKGAGVAGTEVTAAALADYQRIIDSLNEHFVAGVAAGRKMTVKQVQAIADGRVHPAADAQELGLINAVSTLDAVYSQLVRDTRPMKGKAMSESNAGDSVATQAAPVAATLVQIEAACPGADSAFVLQQLRVGATVPAAQSAWMAEQKNQLDKFKADQAEQSVPKPAGKKPGVPALAAGTSQPAETEGDPIAEWNELLDAKIKGGMSRERAVSALAREKPELRQQMVAAYNAQRRAS